MQEEFPILFNPAHSTFINPQTLYMEKAYQNISILFTLILFGLLWGFHKTYVVYFPEFKNFTSVHHIHGATMMTWIVLLIVQPILIRTGRVNLHRMVGKVSYVLAPLIVIMLFLIARKGYHHGIADKIPIAESHAFMVLDLRGPAAFALFYILAMVNRKNSASHMRYMIATSLLMIGPGFARGLGTNFNISIWDGINYTDYTAIAIVAFFLAYDWFKKNNLIPYTVILSVLICENILWHFRMSDAWQGFAAGFAALFF